MLSSYITEHLSFLYNWDNGQADRGRDGRGGLQLSRKPMMDRPLLEINNTAREGQLKGTQGQITAGDCLTDTACQD